MAKAPSDRRFFDAWLQRTRRQLVQSGKLSQVAHVLAQQDGLSAESWRLRLRAILAGEQMPSADLLTRIETIFTTAGEASSSESSQQELF